ncbi:single-stranded-DNA-specific exonuclease RecJ [Thermosynechococcaceae cyanobacterium BACA0444]|uniref:Single-stranded-DNA-specific exonuclease RecJ n=1 Tax=Pseudocalidococcus azoricus BACA0444 TaxID=2918990 RepID=A0AAE4FR74_9CYAN|nr:single-stranded-DNA-specific exonuclease RecJ [Pseudocalidococcus azoricus]MDS3860808.1 single-stranded-DNA-specific exonuclease RecJ [Pseudocalidococcus azoricus BACA0444]
MASLPDQRWHIHPPAPQAQAIAQAHHLSPIAAQLLINRGLTTTEDIQGFLNPQSLHLPAPNTAFVDLDIAVELLRQVITKGEKIAICGDYDADGMTSTALLLRALRAVGANVDYEIPSRMQEGYGINHRIVEDCHRRGVKVILTVDNGIAAPGPIALARQLGLIVIITDHHDLPPELPPAQAILNPKLLPTESPYGVLAGVGVAYILGISVVQAFGQMKDLVRPLLELCTLGTIADLASLTGVNRRWVQRGLVTIPQSTLVGVQALMTVAKCRPEDNAALKPTAVGFRLGPRINAIGRIGDPQVVIDLLTTEDLLQAEALAEVCEETNRRRQELTESITAEAVAQVEAAQLDLLVKRVLVLVKAGWHHGVIGIVASRLVERYGVPVFIATEEDETHLRGSARGIPEFDVFAALQYSGDLLEKFGGHRAAGGFSLEKVKLSAWRKRLTEFANQCLQPEHLKPLIAIDSEIRLDEITPDLWQQLQALQPCGLGNPEPLFCSRNVQVQEQRLFGANQTHLMLTLTQTHPQTGALISQKAKAWNWRSYYPLPAEIDVAYTLEENTWQGNTTLELRLVGVQSAASSLAKGKPKTANRTSLRGNPAANRPNLIVQCPEPPTYPRPAAWLELEDLLGLCKTLRGRVLLYGDQCPYISTQSTPAQIDYDRPRQACDTFLLWNLPPSLTHLRWLLAKGQPQQVYVRNQAPSLPTATELKMKLSIAVSQLDGNTVNLLAWGQTHWVAPSTIVAGLRELGHDCEGYRATLGLEQELNRLSRWYAYTPAELAQLS